MNFIVKWMNESYFESIFVIFDEQHPFLSILDTFLGTFPIRPVSMMPWLLNWIIFRIESAEFILNWIIFWIEPWLKQYWIEYWMNHFLAKFKHWIESDWVSPNTMPSSLVSIYLYLFLLWLPFLQQIFQKRFNYLVRWFPWVFSYTLPSAYLAGKNKPLKTLLSFFTCCNCHSYQPLPYRNHSPSIRH